MIRFNYTCLFYIYMEHLHLFNAFFVLICEKSVVTPAFITAIP